MSNFNIATSLHKHGIISDEEMGKHIDKALSGRDDDEKISAIKHPNATAAHINKALNDDHPLVRELAIQHPNVTSEQLDREINNQRSWVGLTAAKIKNERNL